MAEAERKLLVLSALEFERDQLRRHGIDAIAELHCCGPGRGRMTTWVNARARMDRPIVLAGLAGALTERVQVGSAQAITEVRSATGEVFQPTFAITKKELPGPGPWAVSCPEHSLTSPEAKRAWHEQHGTDLIDLESEAFARAMQTSNQPWAIVRGVSDGPNDTLPANIDRWVDEAGRVRHAAVALAIIRNPAMLGAVRRLGERSKQALQAVAAILRDIT